jgi:hypothetical protein
MRAARLIASGSCLESGLSTAEIARSLHVRRQSLYQRTAKIQQVAGPIEDPATSRCRRTG